MLPEHVHRTFEPSYTFAERNFKPSYAFAQRNFEARHPIDDRNFKSVHPIDERNFELVHPFSDFSAFTCCCARLGKAETASVMVAAMMAMSSRVIWQFLSLTPPNLQLSAVTPTPSTPPADALPPTPRPKRPPERRRPRRRLGSASFRAPLGGACFTRRLGRTSFTHPLFFARRDDFLIAHQERRLERRRPRRRLGPASFRAPLGGACFTRRLGRTSFTRPVFFARRGDFLIAHWKGGFQPPVGPIPEDRRGTPRASPAGSQRPPAESPLDAATPGARKDAGPSRRVKHADPSRRLESRRSGA